MKFVYVFGEENCDLMRNLGFVLLKSDKKRGMYIFENKCTQEYEALPCNAIFSDTLTF